MSQVLGYSDFLKALTDKPSLKSGLVVDTNVLISATYDSDNFFEPTTQFFDYLAENKIPIYCNVNVRAEFLEIHRRIIFTESLIDFFHEVNRNLLPVEVSTQLGKWSANNKRRVDEQRPPLRLSEAEIKKMKLDLMQIANGDKNLWTTLCENKIGNKLESLWNQTDAMIVNMFFCSSFEAIVSSDQEVAHIVGKSETPAKICFVPDSLKLNIF